jgi:hypothetical protein
MEGHNPYVARNGMDDSVNERDFCDVEDQKGHFLQYPLFHGNVDNQVEPFPHPLLISNIELEGEMEHLIQHLHSEMNGMHGDVKNVRHNISRHNKDI